MGTNFGILLFPTKLAKIKYPPAIVVTKRKPEFYYLLHKTCIRYVSDGRTEVLTSVFYYAFCSPGNGRGVMMMEEVARRSEGSEEEEGGRSNV